MGVSLRMFLQVVIDHYVDLLDDRFCDFALFTFFGFFLFAAPGVRGVLRRGDIEIDQLEITG